MNSANAARPSDAILEPERPIVDPHHHLWDGTPLIPTSGTYLLPEFLSDIGSGHRIEATVFIEAEAMYRADGPDNFRSVGEAEFANGVAAMSASGLYGAARVCAGIVGFAKLGLGDRVAEILEALTLAAGGRLRGIRNMSATDADSSLSHVKRAPGLLRDGRFREGFARLAPLGLTFDSWQFHPQLPDVVDLARAFPDTTIIVDHTGGPVRIGAYAAHRTEAYQNWRRAIADLAACPNVAIKLGGLGMRIFGLPEWDKSAPFSQFLADQWRPFFEPCVEAFGPRRCMFESNFPVDRDSTTYFALWNAFKRIAAPYSESEKDALFRGTAARVYRLETAS